MYMDSFFIVASTSYAVPSAPSMVFLRRSEPARSTKLSWPLVASRLLPLERCCTTVSLKTVCERDETSLMVVECVCLSASPAFIIAMTSLADSTSMTVRSRTTTFPELSSSSGRSWEA